MTAPAYTSWSWRAWRPNRSLARATAIAYGASALAAPVLVWGLVRLRDALVAHRRGEIDQERLDTVTQQYLAINGVASLVQVTSLVLVIVLTWRLAKNHELLGRPGTRFGPGWGIAGWLVPFANWIIPFLLLGDLWKGSHPDDAPRTTTWRERPGANVVLVWWALTVTGAIVATVGSAEVVSGLFRSIGRVSSGDDLTDVAESLVGTALRWQVAGLLLGGLTSVVAAVAVTTLADRQDAYAERWQLRSEAGSWAPTAGWGVAASGWSPQPAAQTPPQGWYPDPAGRHELRWWDGARWTADVADGGRVSRD